MGMLTATTTAGSIETFTSMATEVLSWLITSMSTVLTWMLANPICFIGLVVSLIVTVIGTLRHLIGG